MELSQPQPSRASKLSYDAALLFWRIVTQIFFREIRPRGAFNIPSIPPPGSEENAPGVIFVGAPHSNQFLDPLLLSLEVTRETGRRVQFLAAAKSMVRFRRMLFIEPECLSSLEIIRRRERRLDFSFV
jgi:glycerol-3-phosphate O-acyltransferase/dihydroxyacetone phosphate acyltransferase